MGNLPSTCMARYPQHHIRPCMWRQNQATARIQMHADDFRGCSNQVGNRGREGPGVHDRGAKRPIGLDINNRKSLFPNGGSIVIFIRLHHSPGTPSLSLSRKPTQHLRPNAVIHCRSISRPRRHHPRCGRPGHRRGRRRLEPHQPLQRLLRGQAVRDVRHQDGLPRRHGHQRRVHLVGDDRREQRVLHVRQPEQVRRRQQVHHGLLPRGRGPGRRRQRRQQGLQLRLPGPVLDGAFEGAQGPADGRFGPMIADAGSSESVHAADGCCLVGTWHGRQAHTEGQGRH